MFATAFIQQSFGKIKKNMHASKPREQWSSTKIYWLTQIGSAIGLGNLWRFPYLAFKNGGGAFLIPYLLALTLLAMPLFLLELAFGQFYRQGIVGTMTRIHKKFVGVGLFHIATTLLILSYYCTILTWVFHYVVISFLSPLPFKHNAEAYFLQTFLNTSSESPWSSVNMWLVLFLAIIWLAIFISVSRGIKLMSKVSLVLMPICPVLLVILFVRGVLLDGAAQGILYYATPRFELLLNANVWMDAASQIFFSVGLAGGVIPALASYASPTQDIVVDTFVITCSNSFVELFAGFIVFSYLGNLAKLSGVGVDKIAASGPALAFIVFPEALSNMPASNAFCVLFFVTLLLLGITSAYTMVQSIVTSVRDFWPHVNVWFIAFSVCFFEFSLGMLFTTPAGYHLVDIVDHYTSIMLLIGGVLECFVVVVASVTGTFSPTSTDEKTFVYHMPNIEESARFGHRNGSLYIVEYLRKCINKKTVIVVPRLWSFAISWFAPVVTVIIVFATIIVQPSYGGYSITMQLLFGWLPLIAGISMVTFFWIYYSDLRRRCTTIFQKRTHYSKVDIEMQDMIE